jgi:hypothetical protein
MASGPIICYVGCESRQRVGNCVLLGQHTYLQELALHLRKSTHFCGAKKLKIDSKVECLLRWPKCMRQERLVPPCRRRAQFRDYVWLCLASVWICGHVCDCISCFGRRDKRHRRHPAGYHHLAIYGRQRRGIIASQGHYNEY